MKFNDIHFDFFTTEFIGDIGKKWEDFFEKFYMKILRKQQKQRVDKLLAELVERRKKIDDLICTVDYLKALVDETDNLKEICRFEDIYKNVIDKMFIYVSNDISYFIYDIADVAIEEDATICPSTVSTLLNYKIATGVKDYFDSQQSIGRVDLKRRNYQFYLYFCNEKNIYEKIYQQLFWEKYKTFYKIAFDRQKINLDALADLEGEEDLSPSTLQAEIYSGLFRSILSKYIFTWRKNNNVTQSELSQKSGVDRTMIAKVEKLQQTASLDTTIKLLNAIGANLVIIPLSIDF